MNPFLTQVMIEQSLQILLLILVASTIGMLIYLVLCLVEKWLPMLTLLLAAVSTYTLINFCWSFNNPIYSTPLLGSEYATFGFPLLFLVCSFIGSSYHRSEHRKFGSISNAIAVIAGIGCTNQIGKSVWDSLPLELTGNDLLIGMNIRIPYFYFFLSFCYIAPAGTAFFFHVVKNLKLRPGMDKHLDS